MRSFHLPGRSPVHGTRAAVATSHPAASYVALEMMRSGGNAVDAAVAGAAVLAVVEPTETGIGGDCFALYAPAKGAVVALNGSGAAPAASHIEWYQDRGIRALAPESPHAVTVPGAIAAWTMLHADYGRLSLGKVLEPAIRYAAEGYAVHSRIAWDWRRNVARVTQNAASIFLPGGRAPLPGEVHRQPRLAETLEAIASQGREGFYAGPVARALVRRLSSLGGLHTEEDFSAQKAEYAAPVTTSYRGHEVMQCPPNGRGVAALILLNILEGYDLSRWHPMSATRLHLQGEATRLALWAADRHVGDPSQVATPVEEMLSKEYAGRLRARIREDRVMPEADVRVPLQPETVYLAVVDDERNVVSFINSLFHTFGSGIACPETGVLLHNRGLGFSLEPGHPNCIAPRRRPQHTILPALLRSNGLPTMPFAVMGGGYQPAGQAQILTNMIDYGMDVQEAIDLPRSFRFDGRFQLEEGVPAEVAAGLQALGHETVRNEAPLGGAQAVQIDWASGVLTGGSDARKDGCALAV
jgi:gamma-glutamyltranspeptidase/glutathione hydrolase